MGRMGRMARILSNAVCRTGRDADSRDDARPSSGPFRPIPVIAVPTGPGAPYAE